MEALREYILSITAAAVISGVLTAILGKKGMTGTLGTMFCGVFLSIALIRPITTISFDGVAEWIDGFSADAAQTAHEGESMAEEMMASIIKTDCEAYIQDKAETMGLTIQADVTLEDSAPFSPERVLLRGTVSPYARSELNRIIWEDLAIPEENILWTG